MFGFTELTLPHWLSRLSRSEGEVLLLLSPIVLVASHGFQIHSGRNDFGGISSDAFLFHLQLDLFRLH